MERPKPNEGYALENDVSTVIIPDSSEKVNTSDAKNREVMRKHSLVDKYIEDDDSSKGVEVDIKYSLSGKSLEQAKGYRMRVDSWDGETEGFAFVIGDTPTYLSELAIGEKR